MLVESPWGNVFAYVAVVSVVVLLSVVVKLLVVANLSSYCVASAVVGSLFTLMFSSFLSS